MPFGVVSELGRGMDVLDACGDLPKGRRNFGVNLGRPTVTNGDFVAYSSAKVCEPIKLSFGVVSGVGLGIGVLNGVYVLKEKERFHGVSRPLV